MLMLFNVKYVWFKEYNNTQLNFKDAILTDQIGDK